MPLQARNQNNVPREDLPYFIAATTAGIRRQLREANIPAGGLKYDLYLRLCSNGLRIYNDVRGSPEPEDSDNSDWDDDEDEDEDEDEDQDQDDGGSDHDESDSSPSSSDSSDDTSSDSDDDSNDDGPEVPPSGGRHGKKRKRGHGGADIEQVIEVPEAPKPAELADMPAELSMKIIQNLDARGVFNLVVASPQQFLEGNVDAFVLEAEGRRTPAGRNGQSLLEWVVARVANEVDFRTDNRRFVRRVVDAYLATYPSDSPQERSGEKRVEEIMVWLRQVGVNRVLMSAVERGEADIVQLLILLGEDVNQKDNNTLPLENATVQVGPFLKEMNYLLIVFALIAGGADTTSFQNNFPPADFEEYSFRPYRGVSTCAERSLSTLMPQLMLPWSPNSPVDWPVIQNPRDLTIRQFLADERSPIMDRALLALALIITRDTVYPYFEGYDPKSADHARQPRD